MNRNSILAKCSKWCGRMRAKAQSRLLHLLRHIGHYTELHHITNFAGNLEQLRDGHPTSSAETREKILRQFDKIVDQLTMANGVTKTSYANRQSNILSTVLASVQLPASSVRVLDLPASTGIASVSNLSILRKRYLVNSYVLGDLYHVILFDARRRCVFDESGNLLQVAFWRVFINIYRTGMAGDHSNFWTASLIFFHRVLVRYLRKRYHFERGGPYQSIRVIHPKAGRLLADGTFRMAKLDIFKPIWGQYDLILSFNLLQHSYFPPEVIALGVNNIAGSLSEGGVMIIGNTESYIAFQKQNGALIPRLHEGAF